MRQTGTDNWPAESRTAAAATNLADQRCAAPTGADTPAGPRGCKTPPGAHFPTSPHLPFPRGPSPARGPLASSTTDGARRAALKKPHKLDPRLRPVIIWRAVLPLAYAGARRQPATPGGPPHPPHPAQRRQLLADLDHRRRRTPSRCRAHKATRDRRKAALTRPKADGTFANVGGTVICVNGVAEPCMSQE